MKKVYVAEAIHPDRIRLGDRMSCIRIDLGKGQFHTTSTISKVEQLNDDIMIVETANSTYYVLVNKEPTTPHKA